MSKPLVSIRDEFVEFPTYLPSAPDRNPMFLERRVYQGSSGRVYPLPFIDRIAEQPTPHPWRSITLENEYLEIQILPEIGGRIHRLRDKLNGYDAIYYQPVIKPALVGLAGPWISGGIEFNWPQHHRPSTFMPAQVEIEKSPDGAITVWLSEHDPMARMKGMHGVRLRPRCAALELLARVYNRTPDVQTFLWWANTATEVHEAYQSFFPPDVTFVADHAKRAMSTFPRCSGHYYGVNYAERARHGVPDAEQPRQFRPQGAYPPNDLSWYANIPVPTSYMCMGTRGAFFGGYDHRAEAGIVHVANPHVSPGKKQWTWGNHEFGYAWDRLLTDPDARGLCRPYIELMAGVYSDNQPDFSYLQPGETKTWTQRWYPIRKIGPAIAANERVALSLRTAGSTLRLGLHVTQSFPNARISVTWNGKSLRQIKRALSPKSPLLEELKLPRGKSPAGLDIRIESQGQVIFEYRHQPSPPPTSEEELKQFTATEPPAPCDVASVDELYLIGLHLEQYRHATRCPTGYWREGLRRDPGNTDCNLALGRWHRRRGEFKLAEQHLRASITRLTLRNPNPANGEPYYQLGLVLRVLEREDEAYAAFYKATWNQGWAGASYLALAELDSARSQWPDALEHLDRSLGFGTDNLRARALKACVLRKLGRKREADALISESLALDPLDPWLRQLAGKPWLGDNGTRLDVAIDLARAGFFGDAIVLLNAADPQAADGSVPMVHYTRAWLHNRAGNARGVSTCLRAARKASPDYCFPSRIEELRILEFALAADTTDARAHLYLGYWLYDRRREAEAITHWKQAARREPSNAVLWRCLGIGAFNILGNAAEARRAFVRARAAAPEDARLLYEADQLARRMGESPRRRIRNLERHMPLVARRDDLTVELSTLYNHTGQPGRALELLRSRRFQPWEGGEGLALGQFVRAAILLGRECLAANDPAGAIAQFEAALQLPESLGEARHLLANASDLHYWLGEAHAAAGQRARARVHWKLAAGHKGDFQQMRVCSFSEMTYFSACAMRRLGNERGATRTFEGLLAYAEELETTTARIDYFATSLPGMLLFRDDIQARQTTTARFLQAQAHLGLGRTAKARALLNDVLSRDPNHAPATDFWILVQEV